MLFAHRACAEEIYIFSREIFRFASEVKKVYLPSEIEKAKPIRMQKKYLCLHFSFNEKVAQNFIFIFISLEVFFAQNILLEI